MIIDSHFHLEPEIMPINELISAMDDHNIHKTALIASMCEGLAEPPEFLLKAMRWMLSGRITRVMARQMLTRFTPEGHAKLPGGITTIHPEPDNDIVFKAVDAHPDRFLAWVFVNPRGKNNPVEEFTRWKNHPGCVGVKVHPFWHQYRPADLIPVGKVVAFEGKPMLMHAGFGENGDVLSLIKAVPELKLILAHAGFPSYEDLWKQIKPYPNVCVDLSATAYVDTSITQKAVDFLGFDRCIFGTDGPFGSPGANHCFDYGVIKNRIIRQFSEKEVQEKLLGGNFSGMIY